MRILIMFDLPVETAKNRSDYARFRKYLIKSGFLMMQESIYCKLASNSSVGEVLVENIRKNKPPEGLVQVLKITEKQYAKMEYVVGVSNNNMISNDERLLIL